MDSGVCLRLGRESLPPLWFDLRGGRNVIPLTRAHNAQYGRAWQAWKAAEMCLPGGDLRGGPLRRVGALSPPSTLVRRAPRHEAMSRSLLRGLSTATSTGLWGTM